MILMPVLSSEAQTGYLGVPFRLLEIVTLVSVLVLSSAFPIIARAAGTDRARHRYALLRMSEVSIILGLYVGVMAFVGAPLIVRILGGAEFESATSLLRILSVSLAAKFVIAAWAFSLLSLDRHVAVLRANALATVLAIALTVALVPIFDATGGAVATAVSDAAVLLGYAWALHRAPDPVELPWSQFALLIGVSAVAAAVFVLPIPVAAQMVVASAIFGVVLWRTRMLPDELAHALPLPSRRA
jgi:O-antigen/teichoic acid export membrane protein